MKKLKNIITVGCVVVGAYLFNLGFNVLANKEHKEGSYHSVRRADGAFGSTTYTHFYEGDYKMDGVSQFRFLRTSRFIVDGGISGKNDGLVDKIHIFTGRAKTKNLLHRETDYDAHKEEFDKADKLLAETKERFKEYFE